MQAYTGLLFLVTLIFLYTLFTQLDTIATVTLVPKIDVVTIQIRLFGFFRLVVCPIKCRHCLLHSIYHVNPTAILKV